MTDPKPRHAIARWLETKEALAVLMDLARAVCRHLALHRIPLPTGGYIDPGRPLNPQYVEEAASELALFLVAYAERFQHLGNTPPHHRVHYLRRAFINHCLEKARGKATGRFRYLYKRTADVLRSSDHFYTRAIKAGGMVFSRFPDARSPAALTEDDLALIPFPGDKGFSGYGAVNRRPRLVFLAGYFLDCLAERWQTSEVAVQVKDFIAWIGRHVALDAGYAVSEADPTIRSTDEIPGVRSEAAEDAQGMADHGYRPDLLYETHYFEPRAVRRWARQFAERLNPREAAVFSLRFGSGAGFESIARRCGYKGPSGPKYALTRIQEQLKFFMRDLPWLSPAADGRLNTAAFDLFMETLLSILKKRRRVP